MLQRRIAALAVMTAGIIFTALPPAAAGDFIVATIISIVSHS